MASVIKEPPRFSNEDQYEAWKRDVKIWVKLSTLNKKKQSLAIHLSLQGRAKNASSQLTDDELESDEGVEKILAKLDALFLPDKSRRQFAAFDKLYNLRRKSSTPIREFIGEFDYAYHNFTLQEMSLPDSVMAFMLLASCNFSEEDSKLVMTAVNNVSFEEMKSAIMRIFEGGFSKHRSTDETSKIEIKSETALASGNEGDGVYYNNAPYRPTRSRSAGRFRPGSRSYGNRGRDYSSDKRAPYNRRLNPTDESGEISRCVICDSKMHWSRNCPHAYERSDTSEKEKSSETNIISEEKEDDKIVISFYSKIYNEETPGAVKSLIEESKNCAVIDTGCAKTVCGKNWLEEYVNSLSDFEKGLIKSESSGSTFKFGDGVTVKSLNKVTLPCYIGGMKSEITTDVVQSNIPLLLSKQALKKCNVKLNFTTDTINIVNQDIKLKCTSSGHYALPLTL